VASWDKSLQLWSVRNTSDAPVLKKSIALPPGVGPMLDLCWDDGVILAGSSDGSLVGIDVETGVATDCGFVSALPIFRAKFSASLRSAICLRLAQHDGPIRTVHFAESIGAALTGGWDNCFRVFDPRSNKPASATVALGSRVHAADFGSNIYVVATADLRLHIHDVRKLGAPLRVGSTVLGAAQELRNLSLVPPGSSRPVQEAASPLIQQTRAVRLFTDAKTFALTGMEGRCGIRCVSEDEDNERMEGDAAGKMRYSFTFKCHRNNEKIYAVHGVDTHPDKPHVFVTGGGDGVFNLWEKDKRVRLREYKS
jgi:mRNA export factor